ncbi:MAG: SDR family NAD(P)-dependent oxidoreductase, partial [Lysobacteraceae bacterium]
MQPPERERKPAEIDILDTDTDTDTDIAIVGLSCRLPGGIETPADLWNVLAEGACVIEAYPDERGRWPSPREWPAIDQGGFVRGLGAFDAAFFRISPLEAQMMDPQQRLVMELAWSCFEDANVRPADVAGSDLGVFVGASNSDYSRLMQDAGTEVEAHLGVASSLAVIANRVSYFFDLSGPSLLVDTACSSSLVALHTAIQSLHRNECSAALVAGVNVICHPDLSLAYHKAGMLAADGRCKVFDSRADGYVRAEGAVVLLIKPLGRAIAEGDCIHAVIKGSAINHGGLASGLTVPNPVKQRELLMAAWDNAGVRSDEISYIEAHGTGTSLGDPIEVQGIQSAYAQRAATHTLQSCGLGSLKSNLGHLESAAGLAGMLKVILSMQHRQLPPTVNFESLNPKVELDDAFYIQSRLQDWNASVRVAGVSSFGSGGANAHVVLQEFPGIEPLPDNDEPQLFVLSAASRESLREYARRVSTWLDQPDGERGLRSAIYSWQVGRTPMKVRLALKVASRAELKTKLDAWVNDGKDPVHGWFADGSSDAASARLWQTKSARLLIDQALQEKDIDQLAVLWISGIEIDWSRLYDRLPQRVNLPTYPFAKERHWIQAQERQVKTLASAQTSLHPLLHTNVSDLSRQAFRSVLTGEEHFLRDHKVKLRGTDECVLPAVAYLEMARAAVEQAVPADARGAVLELRNCVWAQPLVVRGATPVGIELSGALDGEIEYEIVSGDGARRKDHCQGRAAYVPQTTPVQLDVPMLRARMDRGALGADAVYATFEAMGLMYGPAHRAVRHVYQGEGQLLAQLELPSCVRAGADQYRMHPSLMDGALQACVGLMEASGQSRLPFAVDTVRVLGKCTPSMWVWLRHSPGSRDGDAVTKFDIDLSDEQGTVCVQMCGFSARALGPATATEDASASGVLRAVPQWRAMAEDVAQEAAPTVWAERHVVVCELHGIEIDSLASLMTDSRCVMLSDSSMKDLASRYSEYALSCFERIRAVLSGKPEGAVLMQVVVGESGEDAVFSGLSALLKTATLENPLFRGQLVLTNREVTTAALAQQLEQARAHASEPVIRFDRGTQAQGLGWQVQPQMEMPCEPVFKEHGVYLITGGLGGLGVLFAQAVLEQTRHGRVILTGRGALSGGKQSRFDALVAQGAGRIRYRSLELSDRAQVDGAIAEILVGEGGLHGILHCAGMIADNFILKKSASEFREVLSPKVTGTRHLDEATRAVGLDFFALFSSVASAFGNVGQSDYAAANGFMDGFARYRNGRVSAGERSGRTVSIHWPLWASGGMQLDEALQSELLRTTGMVALSTAHGLQAFYRSVSQGDERSVVMEGVLSKLGRTLKGVLPPLPVARPQTAAVQSGEAFENQDLQEKTRDWLRRQFSALLKLSSHRIDPHAPLEQYGIDSILAMRLTNALEKTFGSLSKTLFFEYRSIAELAEHLVSTQSPVLSGLFAKSRAAAAAVETPAVVRATEVKPATRSRSLSVRAARQDTDAAGRSAEPIAIVGLSGRYPESPDIATYWRNLRDGNDCIVEVPEGRWDWRDYFSEDRTQGGRHYSRWGGFITGVDEFDPQFFNIAPREARYIDPQERLFLQHAWMAVEDAGYSRASLRATDVASSDVGVYVGVMYSEYQLYGIGANAEELRMGFSGNVASIANRVSYALDLHGPSMTLDTMCSSSLTAIHLACQDLKSGRTHLAIAGGVNISIHPQKYLLLSVGQFISSDGHCQSFGEGGDGYIPGEGVGAVVLKRLSDAQRDGDHIYGIIRGSALSHGGRTNGYTVPNPQSQASAIAQALDEAQIDARRISYIEAHGTGTKLGDPIEIAALNKAFGRTTQDRQFCLIGSAKSNIGHCEAAAGIAGLTKVLLQMQHRQVVPSLHSAQLNPHIDFANSPFTVNQTLTDWVAPVVDGRRAPRIAGLSSFGAGGSNAHMIVEEYEAPVSVPWSGPVIVVLSARTPAQLKQQVQGLVDFIAASSTPV